MPDANVIQFAPTFATDTAAVIERCNYIDLLGKDVASLRVAGRRPSVLAEEILKLARANVDGNDASADDAGGSGDAQVRPSVQLRAGDSSHACPWRDAPLSHG